MSFTTIWTFKVKPEAVEEFRDYMKTELVNTRRFDGCENATSLSGADDPSTMVFVVRWSNRSNYDAYLAWRKSTGDNARTNSLVESGSAMLFEAAGF